jgi:outer membrane protein
MCRTPLGAVILALAVICVIGVTTPWAQSNPAEPASAKHVVDLRIIQKDEGIRCEIIGDGDVSRYRTFTLKSPPRIVVDIRDVRSALKAKEFPVDSAEIDKIRLGTHRDKVRVVFDVAKNLDRIPQFQLRQEREKLIFVLGGKADEEAAATEEPVAVSPQQPREIDKTQPTGQAVVAAVEETSKKEETRRDETAVADKAKENEEDTEEAPRDATEEARGTEVMGLQKAINIALENNFGILSAAEAVEGADRLRKSAFTDFFPKLTASGNWSYFDGKGTQGASPPIPVQSVVPPNPIIGFIPGRDEGTFKLDADDTWRVAGSATQPVFTGGAILNRYRLAKINLSSAETARFRIGQDLALQVVRAYFDVLNAIEQKKVSDQAVKLLESQRDVAQEFFNVGMIPKNDVLETEVQLAERIREQTVTGNLIELNKAQFNTILQRPVTAPVELENLLEYEAVPVDLVLERGIELSHEQRLEIKEAELRVEAGERQVRLAQSAYFPQVQLSYTYFKNEEGASSGLDEGWTLEAAGVWNFWEWGKKYQDVSAAKAQLQRDRYALLAVKDQIDLEVKAAYLQLITAERNIFVAKKAVEQGQENFRMNQERYKEQVGTSTEVLDAETLLRRAEADYYNSLRNYNVAKAALRYAVGYDVYGPIPELNIE